MDLTILYDYMIELDDFSLGIIDNSIKESGSIEVAFHKQLFYLDCTRIYEDGMRPIQTIGYPYRREMAAAIYMIKQVEDTEIQEKYFQELADVHFKNLEFEKENPPVWYNGEKGKKKFEKMVKKCIPRREKKASQSKPKKLKDNSLKLSLLKINIKL